MQSVFKNIFRLSAIYGFGDIFVKGIRFLLLPLYTAYLAPDEYGIWAMALVVSSISTAILSLGLNGAAFKFYYDLEGEQRKRFHGTLWLFFLAVPSATLILIEVAGKGLFDCLITSVPYSPYLRMALWLSFFTVAFTSFSRELLKASERAITYILLNMGQSILVIGLAIWLVVGLRKGAEGVLWAHLIGVGVIASICVLILWKYVSLSFDPALLKRALVFGLPLMPHFLAHLILGASDKVILNRYVHLSEVGIYSVGYLLGSAMMVFIVAFNNAMLPLFGKTKRHDIEAMEKLVKVTTYYVLAISIVGLCIALFSREIISLLTSPSYDKASSVVPWIVLGYFFMGIYFIPMTLLTLVLGNTRAIPFCTTFAAGINIILNLLLIPKYGMMAAAITTAFSYFVMFLGVFFIAQLKGSFHYEYRRIATILIAGLCIFLVGWNITHDGIFLSVLFKFTLIIVFFVLLFFTKFFNIQEKQYILKKVYAAKRVIS